MCLGTLAEGSITVMNSETLVLNHTLKMNMFTVDWEKYQLHRVVLLSRSSENTATMLTPITIELHKTFLLGQKLEIKIPEQAQFSPKLKIFNVISNNHFDIISLNQGLFI